MVLLPNTTESILVNIRLFQKGFNYSQDGPGNRLVYHLQGCNMRCPWCSNPEGIARKGSLLVNRELLIDSLCPHGAIEHQQIDRNQCAECSSRACLHENQNQGIRLSSHDTELESVVDEAKRSAALFFGGGGVTLSGGEPTLQFAATKALLARLQEEGIHTAIETNATHPRLPELLPLIDYLIMDYKHHDNARLKALTGVGNAVIKRNLKQAFTRRQPMLVRIPVIGGFNDSADDIERFADFFSQFDCQHASFEFLAFHEFGKIKWEQCGLPYQCANTAPAAETLAAFQAVFQAHRLNVLHT